jgi:hypothetical protein
MYKENYKVLVVQANLKTSAVRYCMERDARRRSCGEQATDGRGEWEIPLAVAALFATAPAQDNEATAHRASISITLFLACSITPELF